MKHIHPLKEIVVHPSSRKRYAPQIGFPPGLRYARGIVASTLCITIGFLVTAKLCGAGTISHIGAAYPTCHGGTMCSRISFVSADIETPGPFIVFEGNPSSRKRFAPQIGFPPGLRYARGIATGYHGKIRRRKNFSKKYGKVV